MVIPKGTLVRAILVDRVEVLDHDVEGGILLQTDKRIWLKDDATGTVYIVDLVLPTEFGA